MKHTHKTTIVSASPSFWAIALLCMTLSLDVFAFTNTSSQDDDETILIEQPAKKAKLSYSTALKSFSKHILKFDIDTFLSGGKNCRDAVIRNFSDLSERTKYRLNLKHDRVEMKFTLNF